MSIELESHLSDFSNHSNDNRIMIVNWCLCFVIEKKEENVRKYKATCKIEWFYISIHLVLN